MDRQPNNMPSVADLLSRARNGDESALYAIADIASRAEQAESELKKTKSALYIIKHVSECIEVVTGLP